MQRLAPGLEVAAARGPSSRPRSRRSVARARFQPVCPERSRQTLRRRLARVIGKGVASARSGSASVQVLAWCCR